MVISLVLQKNFTSFKFKSTSYEFKTRVASSKTRVTSSNPQVTSSNLRVTSTKTPTSFPAYLFAIRGGGERGPGTLKTRD